ncbi:MAG TPA: hypothetical protein VNF75_03470 [Candidatus Dormibacteraeota bacterium]|nr:hypothetical protein [Candidatus Dormibacteraeota bacterium]
MTTQTPDQVAANWAARLASSTSKITAGVQGVTTSPGQAAARQQAAYVQNVQANAAKWAARTAAVPLNTWQQDTINKGIPRIATGATAAIPKFTQVMTSLLPYIQSQVNALPARGTLDQNIARMTSFVQGMAKYSKPAGS